MANLLDKIIVVDIEATCWEGKPPQGMHNDIIEIDAVKNTLTLKVSDDVIAQRKANWKQPALKATNGVLYKYAKLVKTATEGCVTDE